MATAMSAGAAATGLRAWLAARRPRWMTVRRLRIATAAILAIAVLAAGTQMGPNAPAAGAGAASGGQSR
jgi:hypothetical protein